MIKPGQIIGRRVGGDPEDESEHFYTCKLCGQLVAKRDLGEVMHHEQRPVRQALASVLDLPFTIHDLG